MARCSRPLNLLSLANVGRRRRLESEGGTSTCTQVCAERKFVFRPWLQIAMAHPNAEDQAGPGWTRVD